MIINAGQRAPHSGRYSNGIRFCHVRAGDTMPPPGMWTLIRKIDPRFTTVASAAAIEDAIKAFGHSIAMLVSR